MRSVCVGKRTRQPIELNVDCIADTRRSEARVYVGGSTYGETDLPNKQIKLTNVTYL